MAKQLSFQNTNWRHRYSHGGLLRQKRAGRGARPLSSKEPIHLVFKANKDVIKGGFRSYRRFALIHHLLQKYQAKFFIKIEQVSIQGDHIHLLIRTSRRSLFQNFFRVLAGQIAQRFEKEGLLSVAVAKTLVNRSTPENSKAAASPTHVTGTPTGFGSIPGLRRNEKIIKSEEAVRRSDSERTLESVMLPQGKLTRLWKHRPFTRVVKGFKAYKTVREYIQLNEKEALGDIPYRS
ncbi:MAG: transposase, partial [Pseudobdellovibrionaceae bacterium]